MRKFSNRSDPQLITMLKDGAVGVLLTDTLYGVVASANSPSAVERLYDVRNRDFNKPCIVLISRFEQIWDNELPARYKDLIDKYWPGKVSIILPAGEKTPEFVHRGFNGTVAFRMPDDPELSELLDATGPLLAPSANRAGEPPAMKIIEAESYFGDKVDFYVDSGPCSDPQPSRLIELTSEGEIKVLR